MGGSYSDQAGLPCGCGIQSGCTKVKPVYDIETHNSLSRGLENRLHHYNPLHFSDRIEWHCFQHCPKGRVNDINLYIRREIISMNALDRMENLLDPTNLATSFFGTIIAHSVLSYLDSSNPSIDYNTVLSINENIVDSQASLLENTNSGPGTQIFRIVLAGCLVAGLQIACAQTRINLVKQSADSSI